jgi:hypothetical protein
MRQPSAPLSRTALLLGLVLIHAALVSPARAQLAVSSQITARGLNASYANGSGFSLFTTGEVNYTGPLNTAESGVVPPSLSVRLNGDTVFSGDLPGVADALPERATYPRLSPELREATIDVGSAAPGDGSAVLKTGVGETLPLFVELAVSLVNLTVESVDGQSFSVYPRFTPSLQLPRESGLYSDPNDPNNPNAAKAGPTLLNSTTFDNF